MNAAQILSADLEQRRGGRLLRGVRFLVNLVGMAVGGLDVVADVDLVVRRRDTGREIMRTPANVGDPEILVHRVRRDLEEKTVEEFIAEWRLPNGTTA